IAQPLALLATLAANKMGDALSGLIALARHQLTQDLTFVDGLNPVSYTHLTLPTMPTGCRSRWSPGH
ncbi:hypothetical protein, partial [Serratia sp. ASV30]|uniref:hypothetical protein n=1 Tax=Serratia sp. ASV30 TaxID=2795127 RepID=UPI0018EDE9A1